MFFILLNTIFYKTEIDKTVILQMFLLKLINITCIILIFFNKSTILVFINKFF